MVDPAELCLKLDGLLLDAFVDGLEDFDEGVELPLESELDFDVLELPLADADEGLLGPLAEPVDGGAVDEGGEHAEAGGEDLAHGAHADDVVNVALDPGEVHAEDVHLVGL